MKYNLIQIHENMLETAKKNRDEAIKRGNFTAANRYIREIVSIKCRLDHLKKENA